MSKSKIPELVGISQIAARLNVPRSTVDSWKRRGKLPEPSTVVGGHPFWIWADLEKQVERTEAISFGRNLHRKKQ